MIRVKYNSNTKIVQGTYPSFINYPNIVIDEENKTIDGEPYIEITQEEHQANLGKTMCVIDGVYQEYVKPDSELLEEAKTSKRFEIEEVRKAEQYSNIIFDGNEYLGTHTAQTKLFNLLSMTTGDIEWRLADDITWITLTRSSAEGLRDSLIAREIECYKKESIILGNIEASTTLEELGEINW